MLLPPVRALADGEAAVRLLPAVVPTREVDAATKFVHFGAQLVELTVQVGEILRRHGVAGCKKRFRLSSAARASLRGMKPLMIAAVVMAGVVAAVLILLWTLQRSLMYFPMGDVPAAGAAGLTGVEAVTFATSDGLTLHAWFVAASGALPRPTVLVFSGNAGHRGYRAPLAAALQRHGFHVLLVDYRGYGGNPGTPTQSGLTSDSRAARAYLASRVDVDASRLVYFGESLGTAVAVDLAADHAPAALVLRSPFTSMADVGQYHYPLLPVRRLLRDRFAAIDQIRRVRVPLLVIAGGNDRIVPPDHSRRLFDAANEPKTLLVIPNADHNDDELLAGDQMIEAIVAFIRTTTSDGRGVPSAGPRARER